MAEDEESTEESPAALEQEKESTKRPPWWKRLWGWTGFGEKKLWDWLQLLSALAIPVVLAVAGFWFTAQQEQRQQQIEAQRAESERELAEQRAQDEALQAYFDQMSNLLLEKDLRTADEDSEVRTLARARTVTVLGRLDPGRKTAVMQFLAEAQLIQSIGDKAPIIALTGADLSGASLDGAFLSGAQLAEADLSDTLVRGGSLDGAILEDAVLSGADLSPSDMSGAKLALANLYKANLGGCDLSGADLGGAVLIEAYLGGAVLEGADFTSADLTRANLEMAEGVNEEELERQAKSLKGATMPNGQKYEDWLKDKEGRGEEAENGSPS